MKRHITTHPPTHPPTHRPATHSTSFESERNRLSTHLPTHPPTHPSSYRLHPLQIDDVLNINKQRMKTDKSGHALQLSVGRCVHMEYKGLPQIRKEQVYMNNPSTHLPTHSVDREERAFIHPPTHPPTHPFRSPSSSSKITTQSSPSSPPPAISTNASFLVLCKWYSRWVGGRVGGRTVSFMHRKQPSLRISLIHPPTHPPTHLKHSTGMQAARSD